MAETYDQKKRHSENLFNVNFGAASDETTPQKITRLEEDFARELGGSPRYLPVVSDPYGLFGWCSDGVLEKVKHDGGNIRFGWTLWEWPKIFLNAEFHAVWVSPTGDLIDITPKPQGEQRILFVEDASYPPDFDFDKRPGNKRFQITIEPDYIQLATALIQSMKPRQLEYETKRAEKNGATLTQWIANKQPRPELPVLIDKLIDVCNAVDRKTDELSGLSGQFTPDRQYIELSQLKIALVARARQLVRSVQ